MCKSFSRKQCRFCIIMEAGQSFDYHTSRICTRMNRWDTGNEGNRLIDSYIVIRLTEQQWRVTCSSTCQKNNWPLITFRLHGKRSCRHREIKCTTMDNIIRKYGELLLIFYFLYFCILSRILYIASRMKYLYNFHHTRNNSRLLISRI